MHQYYSTMPYRMYYIPSKKCYTVRKKKTKKPTKKRTVFAKCTTKEKAKKQLNLLRAITYNPNFQRRTRKKFKKLKK